jgi:hypothetical protein
MYELLPEAPVSITSMTHSFVADELDELAIGSILEHLEESSPPSTEALAAVELRVLGGAISRIPIDATAFAHRQRKLVCSGLRPSGAMTRTTASTATSTSDPPSGQVTCGRRSPLPVW